MGNYIYKYLSHNTEMHSAVPKEEEIENPFKKDTAIVENDVMQTPIIHKTFPIDPRSVTSGIDRTPIEMNSTPIGLNKGMISAIPKRLQSGPYLETDIDKAFLCLTPRKHFLPKVISPEKLGAPDTTFQNAETFVTPTANNVCNRKLSAIQRDRYKILGIDPRSPAANFDRTPILTPKSLQRLRARSLENLHRRGSYDTDIFYPKLSYCEVSSQFNLTEIQALPDLAVCTIRSLDLVNVNSDDNWNDSCSSHSSESENDFENCNEITTIEDSIENSVENGIFKDDIKTNERELALQRIECNLHEIGRNSKQDHCNGIKKSTESEETYISDNDLVKIWKDSLVLDEPERIETMKLKDTQVVEKAESKREVILTCDDDNIVKDTLSLKFSKCESDKVRISTVEKRKSRSKSYDGRKVFNTNDKNGNENTKNRTPLANCSNNGQKQLVINSPQQVFKSKGITPKMLQENTPPHKKYVTKAKLNGIHWDPDSTVII